VELDVGAVIVASGYEVFDPSRIPEYQYREIPNVVTAIEFERLLSASGPTGGHLDRPSDLAVEAEIETLKKAHKKSLKQLTKLEEKFGESSADSTPTTKRAGMKAIKTGKMGGKVRKAPDH
jgi:hypothetical protein